MRHDVLRDHDRVVHQEAERQQERDHRDHVDRVANRRKEEEGSQERDREPEGDPEREPELEEERQGNEHQEQALPAVGDQHVESALDVRGHVSRQDQARRLAALSLLSLDEGLDGREHAQGVLGLGLGDLEQSSPLAVEEGLLLGDLEGVADRGDIPQAQLSAARAGDHHELAELVQRATLILKANQDVLAPSLHGPRREAHALIGDGLGEAADAQAKLEQGVGRDVDPEVVVREAVQLDLRDLRVLLETALEVLAVGLELRRLRGA